MSQSVLLLIGTKKGIFIARSDSTRRDWRLSGPHVSGTWTFQDVRYDLGTHTIYAAGASNWYGPAVWWSHDLGETWAHSSEGFSLGEGEPDVEELWRIQPVGDLLYAGANPAGLFRSEDRGRTWTHLAALRTHASRERWQPSNAGLPLHAIVPQACDAARMWVAISAGGIYGTADGGETWQECGATVHPCVHALVKAGGGERETLYQQTHDGLYRSDDGGHTWQDISAGLPSRFGFPLAVHPREADTVYAVPLDGSDEGRRRVPDGRMAVWRTRDAGASWQPLTRGLPQERAYLTVLRGGLAVDSCNPAGIYAGTPTGHLFGSVDEGDSWFDVFRGLPPIYALTCAVI